MLTDDPFSSARDAGLKLPPQTAKARVAVCCAHTSDFQPLADITVPTIQAWAERHGYSFFYEPRWEDRIPNDGDRMKIRMYENLYAEGNHDVFVWIDTDALVTRPEVDVESLLTKLGVDDDHHFLWAYDVGGPNTGVYFARFTREARAYLRTSFSRAIEMGWGDNTAMIQLSLVPPHSGIIRCVPGRYMNAYLYEEYAWQDFNEIGDWRTARAAGDDFVLHFPGIPQDRRIELARAIVKEVYG